MRNFRKKFLAATVAATVCAGSLPLAGITTFAAETETAPLLSAYEKPTIIADDVYLTLRELEEMNYHVEIPVYASVDAMMVGFGIRCGGGVENLTNAGSSGTLSADGNDYWYAAIYINGAISAGKTIDTFTARITEDAEVGDTFDVALSISNFATGEAAANLDFYMGESIDVSGCTIHIVDDDSALGDVNFDGEITLEDATLALQTYTNENAGLATGLKKSQYHDADVDGDGVVTPTDAQYILTYYAEAEEYGSADFATILKLTEMGKTGTIEIGSIEIDMESLKARNYQVELPITSDTETYSFGFGIELDDGLKYVSDVYSLDTASVNGSFVWTGGAHLVSYSAGEAIDDIIIQVAHNAQPGDVYSLTGVLENAAGETVAVQNGGTPTILTGTITIVEDDGEDASKLYPVRSDFIKKYPAATIILEDVDVYREELAENNSQVDVPIYTNVDCDGASYGILVSDNVYEISSHTGTVTKTETDDGTYYWIESGASVRAGESIDVLTVTLDPTMQHDEVAFLTLTGTDDFDLVGGRITVIDDIDYLGDVNGDELVNPLDAYEILEYVAAEELTGNADIDFESADVDKSGTVDLWDAYYILCYYDDRATNQISTWSDLIPSLKKTSYEDARIYYRNAVANPNYTISLGSMKLDVETLKANDYIVKIPITATCDTYAYGFGIELSDGMTLVKHAHTEYPITVDGNFVWISGVTDTPVKEGDVIDTLTIRITDKAVFGDIFTLTPTIYDESGDVSGMIDENVPALEGGSIEIIGNANGNRTTNIYDYPTIVLEDAEVTLEELEENDYEVEMPLYCSVDTNAIGFGIITGEGIEYLDKDDPGTLMKDNGSDYWYAGMYMNTQKAGKTIDKIIATVSPDVQEGDVLDVTLTIYNMATGVPGATLSDYNGEEIYVCGGQIHILETPEESESEPESSFDGQALTGDIGDVNGDGEIDPNDATACLRAYANDSLGRDMDLTDDQKILADVDGNGIIDPNDAYYILVYYAQVSLNGFADWANIL